MIPRGAMLEQFSGGIGDTPRKEEIIEHKQIGFEVGAQQRGLLLGTGQCEVSELGVGLDVANIMALP